MKTIRRALCALALGPASAAYADFSWELAGLVGQADRLVDIESENASLSGAYYVDPVADGSGPLALAAFLDPTTSLLIAVSKDEETVGTGGGAVFERETRDYAIGGRYVFPRSRWYAGGRYSSGEFDQPPPPPPPTVVADSDETGYALIAGKYFGTGATRLQLSLERSILETEQSINFCPITICLDNSVQAETTVDVERLDVMHVRRFRSATYVLLGGIARRDSLLSARIAITLPGQPPLPTEMVELGMTSDTYAVGAELYPVPTVGVRLGYTREDGPMISAQDTVNIGVSWFFRRNAGLELTLSNVDYEFQPRTDGAALRVIGRLR